MKDSDSVEHDPRHDPSRRLLVRVPAERRFLPVLVTACRIYSHALPGGRQLHSEIAQAVADAVSRAFSGTSDRVDVELRVTGNRLQAVVGDDVLQWEIVETDA